MKEVEPDNKWLNEELEPVLFAGGPTDAELITITLLTRLYDIGIAILTSLDEEKANTVYEAHEKGENFNPPMYIPDLKVEDE